MTITATVGGKKKEFETIGDAIAAQEKEGKGAGRRGEHSRSSSDYKEKEKDSDEDEPFNGESAATITNLLRQYGLEELVGEVDRWVRKGLTWPEIEMQLMDPGTKAGKVVDTLYPEIRERREAGHKPVSIGEIQTFRSTTRQMLEAMDLDAALDPAKVAREWLVGDRSLAEMSERLDMLTEDAVMFAATDPAARAEAEAWERFYGVKPTPGDLASMALRPDLATTVLQRRVSAVAADVSAGRAGFGDLSQVEAETIGASSSRQEQDQIFGALARDRELFSALDRGEDEITREEQLGAGFSNSAAAQRRIEQRRSRRIAGGHSGGSLATSRSGGFGGLTTSSDT